jgi:hypothetical protein
LRGEEMMVRRGEIRCCEERLREEEMMMRGGWREERQDDAIGDNDDARY